MRTITRVLLAGVTVVCAALPDGAVASKPNEYCSYYHWDSSTQTWDQAWYFQRSEAFEAEYVKGIDWHCKYNCLEIFPLTRPDNGDPVYVPETVAALVADVAPVLDPVLAPVRDLYAAATATIEGPDPFQGPDCPDVPPVVLP